MDPNAFEVHWKETHKGDTVTHVQEFNRQQGLTNITNINRVPIPAGFDQFDLDSQMNNKSLFPAGSPVAADQFPFFALCGTMSQSLETARLSQHHLPSLLYLG